MLSAVAEAGVRLDMETVDPKGASGERRLDLQGDKVRIDLFSQEATASGGVNRVPGGTTIFDGSEMFIVDHRSKTYVVVDPGQVKSQSERMKEHGEDSSKVTFKKGSGGDKVAGFACSNYAQSRDGVERATVCIASWKTGPVKKEDLGGLLKFAQTMGPALVSKKAMLIDPDDWPGFPLSSQSNDGQSLRLKSASRTTLPDNEFQPPADYTRREMPSIDRGGAP
jgi:Domain of unknown function (DUF4412)